MNNLQNIVNSAVGHAKGSQDVYAKVKSEDLTEAQKQAVKYFFARLQRVYQAEYRRQLPDESSERACKAEFADRVMNITKRVMDKGFDALHDELCNPDSSYRFMRMDAVIDLIKTGGNVHGVQDGAYKEFQKALPEPEEYKHKRQKVGAQTLNTLKGMFDE